MFRSEESEQQGGDLADAEPRVPAATAASWQTAETQVFTALLSRPDVYQSAIAVVGATVDRLRLLGPSTRALLDAAATITTVVGEARAERGWAADGIDPDLVGRAALALRHREVMVEQAATRRLNLLAAARATTVGWVVLEETGDRAGDPFAPYRRLEAHATTGQALLVTAVPDEDFRTSRHEVDMLSVDLHTGRIVAPTDRESDPGSHPSATDREAYVMTLRERLSRSG
jgi:hypothetical protein